MFPDKSLKNRCWLLVTCFWLIGCLMLIPASGRADTGQDSKDDPTATATLGISDYLQQLDQAETRFKNNADNAEVLQKISNDMLVVSTYAPGCITEHEAKLLKLNASVESLGEAATNDPVNVTRKDLSKQVEDVEKMLAKCRLLQLRSKDLLEQTQQAKKAIVRELLFAKTPSLLQHSLDIAAEPRSLQQEVLYIIEALKDLPLEWENLRKALIYGLLGMLAGLFWSLYTRHDAENPAPYLAKASPVFAGIWHSIIRTSPGLLLCGLISLSFMYSPVGMEAVNELALTLLVFVVSYTILRVMLGPRSNLPGFYPLVPRTRTKLFFWWRFLLLTTLLGAFFQSDIFDVEPASNLVGLIRISLGTLIGLALMRVMWLLRKHLEIIKHLYLHLLTIGTLLVAVGALLTGYGNFAGFLFKGVFGTLLILLVGWLLIRIPIEIFDSTDKGATKWQKNLRRKMALEKGQHVPGLIWLRLLHILVVGSVIVIFLLRLWGMSEQSFNLMIANIINGYKIGDFVLEPLSILGGLLILALGILLIQPFKRSLSNSWLEKTNLSQGAKEAMVTIAGYAGTALAVFIGLSTAGFEFSNLAIVAGALSLGIGFGLQNIVNNFISGLILLFERPIRRGDWVRAGASEGYVKNISIRSTVIHTFDRADIIVPNSELISNQVTNMMLTDQFGRIIIPLRVAYGTDTEKVIDVLRGVAEIHPETLREQGKLLIQVILRSFGETALHFELRVHIRDVEQVMVVTSELNLAIDKAFRKAGIEMALPRQIVEVERLS